MNSCDGQSFKSVLLYLLLLGFCTLLNLTQPCSAQTLPEIEIIKDQDGAKLKVNGRDFFIKGVNWDYIPAGENYRYPFWSKNDDFIKKVLDLEMSLIKDAGINTIRQYTGIPPRWVDYIYDTYGIYTVINPVVGRYGVHVDGSWQAQTDYSDPKVRKAIIEQTIREVEAYKDCKGVLIWLLGNENNYGLHWSSFEIENLPKHARDDARAKHLYSLFEEVTQAIKNIDKRRPVAIANGDLQYIDIIAKETPSIDLFASNVYRGASAGDLFAVVKSKLDKPFFFSEFGADAYDAKREREDDMTQARYLRDQWKEIYLNTYGQGVGNVIGGLTFQWSDGWWKHDQERNLDIQDTTASWSNAAYPEDFMEDRHNMNEEWFGIAAKTPPDPEGISHSIPRTAYYVLREAYKLNPYEQTRSAQTIAAHFNNIDPLNYSHLYSSRRQMIAEQNASSISVSHFRLRMENIYAGGDNTSKESRPGWKEFDHLESAFINFHARHGSRIQADLSLNIIGNVPQNRINELFYENRQSHFSVLDEDGKDRQLSTGRHIVIHSAKFDWDDDKFHLEGFYRSGHGHWGYEGDFFNFFPESYDLTTIDMYNANAPIGFVLSGKDSLSSWKLAWGPELYWGANPGAILKYYKEGPNLEWSLLYQQDVGQKAPESVGGIVPEPKTQKGSLYLGWKTTHLKLSGGLLVAGREKIGDTFSRAEKTAPGAGYRGTDTRIIDQVEIEDKDTFGSKLKLVYTGLPVHLYSQLIYKGLVANSGADQVQGLSGWILRDSGIGNQRALYLGASYWLGSLQLAPHFMFRRPLEGPLPDEPALKGDILLPDGSFSPGVRLRNIMSDPFAVRDNRAVNAYELVLLYDPTPATEYWRWDQERIEDAPIAGNINFVYHDYKGSRDSLIGFTEDGAPFPFNQAPPNEKLWEVIGRLIINLGNERKLLINSFVGTTQANSGEDRLIKRHGLGLRLYHGRMRFDSDFRFHDFGPYDYHNDYGLTFPFQAMVDFSYRLNHFIGHTVTSNIGLRLDYRTLDQHSPRYPYEETLEKHGNEFQLSSYIDIAL